MSAPISFFKNDDPLPYRQYGRRQASPFVLVCDHAGRKIPRGLGSLGVSDSDRQRHIAWDIGIGAVAQALHHHLGAPLVEQVYSRLVIDCNRAPGHPTSIPEISDGTTIPGNFELTNADRRAREECIFHPYHACIDRELSARNPHETVLISLHSFTPIWQGERRKWEAGVLFHDDDVSAEIMHNLLSKHENLVVGRNEPYRMTATSDYTIPFHAETRGMPNLEIEIRQDLIANETGQNKWAKILARLLPIYWHEWNQRKKLTPVVV